MTFMNISRTETRVRTFPLIPSPEGTRGTECPAFGDVVLATPALAALFMNARREKQIGMGSDSASAAESFMLLSSDETLTGNERAKRRRVDGGAVCSRL